MGHMVQVRLDVLTPKVPRGQVGGCSRDQGQQRHAACCGLSDPPAWLATHCCCLRPRLARRVGRRGKSSPATVVESAAARHRADAADSVPTEREADGSCRIRSWTCDRLVRRRIRGGSVCTEGVPTCPRQTAIPAPAMAPAPSSIWPARSAVRRQARGRGPPDRPVSRGACWFSRGRGQTVAGWQRCPGGRRSTLPPGRQRC